jgi:hypothetical protein
MRCRRVAWLAAALVLRAAPAAADDAAPVPAPSPAPRVLQAEPHNYLTLLLTLQPGDTLLLAPGRYGVDGQGRDTDQPPGLPVYRLHGTPQAPIVITGPESGPWPVLLGRAGANTVRLGDTSHVVIRHLEIDNRGMGVAGVSAQGPTHHVTLENLLIRGVGDHQATVAIAANRAPAWNWTVRCNRIEGAGTGMYFGNSDGRNPFVAGLIEHNTVLDTIGYSLQVKHQLPWAGVAADMPGGATVTVIRHNVFAKRVRHASDAGPRPNLLVGDQPDSGPGADNSFDIHGNLLFQNPTEALFQGEGRFTFRDNRLVNTEGSAMRVQRHNGAVRDVEIRGNTIVARDEGIAVAGGLPGSVQRVSGNRIFAAVPLVLAGAGIEARDNLTGPVTDAAGGELAPSPPAAECRRWDGRSPP